MILRTVIILFIVATCFGCTSQGDFNATFSTDVKIKSIDGNDIVIAFKLGRIDVLESVEIPKDKATQLKKGNYVHSTIELVNNSFNGAKYTIFFLGELIENRSITAETMTAELPFIKDAVVTWLHADDVKKHEKNEKVGGKPEVKFAPKTVIPNKPVKREIL